TKGGLGFSLSRRARAGVRENGTDVRQPAPDFARAQGSGAPASPGSVVHVAIDGQYRGFFTLSGALRAEASRLITNLSAHYTLALLSGDTEKHRAQFEMMFGRGSQTHFNQSPLNKLEFVRQLQQSGRTVLMVGDGLNDAGALKQSDVGIALVDNIHAFSPASDVIMAAEMLPRLSDVLRFSKMAVRVVQASFLISALYNAVGIAIAARGMLSPVVCAILMPLSSVTVVAFACGMTMGLGKAALNGRRDKGSVGSADGFGFRTGPVTLPPHPGPLPAGEGRGEGERDAQPEMPSNTRHILAQMEVRS
ncbi:MAG: HAD-IC family P-type ATPase, partial [Verrucomicrobia bacterium]|nr:HAD-IC family P-type ATPase [Verrucomicrobiota bacterium]